MVNFSNVTKHHQNNRQASRLPYLLLNLVYSFDRTFIFMVPYNSPLVELIN